MNEEKDLFENRIEADRLYCDSYRQGEGHCAPTNPENRFDEAPASVKLPTPETEETAVVEGIGDLLPIAAAGEDGPAKGF